MAHVETLERLMGTLGPVQPPSGPSGRKGPRETYETVTSDPSFGHLWHRDGMPVSRHISYQQDPLPQSAMPLFHIPWHGDIRLSRADILFDGDLGQAELRVIDELSDTEQRKYHRSAYVETVHDVSALLKSDADIRRKNLLPSLRVII